MKTYIVRLLVTMGFFFFANNVYAAEYWMAPNGSDGDIGSEIAPWATFSHAFSQMAGGDTLWLYDGEYIDSLYNPPNGLVGAPTIIRAVNDFGVIVNGEGKSFAALHLYNSTYCDIRGIHFKSGNTSGVENVAIIGGYPNYIAEHINISKCIFQGMHQSENTQYASTVAISQGNYITIEQSLAFGKGRYKMYAYRSDHIIFRQNVIRFDASAGYSGMPQASFTCYDTSNSIFENNVTIDGQQGGPSSRASFLLPGHYLGLNNNKFLGNIALDDTGNGLYLGWGGIYEGSGQTVNGNEFINNVVWNATGPGLSVYEDGTVTDSWTRDTIIRYNTSKTTIANENGRGYSTENGPVDTILEYNIFLDNNIGVYGPVVVDNNGFNGNTNDVSAGAVLGSGNNLNYTYPMYITRGGNWGATIEKKYNNGVITNNDLWPFPNEGIFKTVLISAGATRGWTASNKTLTEYIWEYLGNQIPCEIYNTCGVVIRADVDQSSSINSTDALLTLRNSLGLDMSSTNWQVSSTTGDVNCDDVTNSTDALLILRESLGLGMTGTGWCVS